MIDRRRRFFGSTTAAPRSANLSTEWGAVIGSPPLARELLSGIGIHRLQCADRVCLAPLGSTLQWLSNDGDKEMILNHEPDSTPWLRVKARRL